VKRIHVFTLVPQAFAWFVAQHPLADAVDRGLVDIVVHNIRDYTRLSHHAVDDTPYGGGAGMVIRVDVVAWALEAVFGIPAVEVRAERDVLVLAPGGRPFDDAEAGRLATSPRDVVLLCGRYEGFDARVKDLLATGALSVGPYVLAGGEVAAMAVVEAAVRKIPGVLGNEESTWEESFSGGLGGAVEYPHYTRPREFLGSEVPEILLGGHHAEIAAWRRRQAVTSPWEGWCSVAGSGGLEAAAPESRGGIPVGESGQDLPSGG